MSDKLIGVLMRLLPVHKLRAREVFKLIALAILAAPFMVATAHVRDGVAMVEVLVVFVFGSVVLLFRN